MKSIILVLSTGRCGTQSLASCLDGIYSDVCTVTHEPLEAGYRPPRFFRAYDRLEAMLEIPEVAEHFAFVEATSRDRVYVETGWPCYAAIPLFIEKFGKRVRVAHVVRHPVPTALSIVAHKFYQPEERNDSYVRLAQLTPDCPGVFQVHLAESWGRMSAYEKCLLWWTELQLYARELESRRPEAPFRRFKMENLFSSESDALCELVEFMGLPQRAGLAEKREERVDRWREKTDLPVDWKRISAYPDCVAAAVQLGYDWRSVDARSLRDRYRFGLRERIRRALQR